MITMIIIYTLFYGVAEWLQQAHGASPAIVGLIMIPVSVVAMGIAGTCARAIPPRIGLALGCAGAAVSCVFLGQVQAGASFVWIAAIFAISGAINGFNGVGNQAALYAQAPVAHVGVAAGIFRTVQYVGGILSATLIGAAFSGGATDAKFHVVTWILVGLSGLLALGVVGDRTIPAHDTVPAMR
jgi:hypothetical protein